MPDRTTGIMLNDRQIRELETWLRSAKLWSETSQAMVGAATDLTNASRSLATQFERPPAGSDKADHGDRLTAQLRLLAETIEDEGRELRDRYLTTQAELDLYAGLLD